MQKEMTNIHFEIFEYNAERRIKGNIQMFRESHGRN